MKIRFPSRSATFCLWFAALSGIALGRTLHYWNVSGTGGDGIWGTSPGEKNWNAVQGAAVGNIAWPDTVDDVAVFQDGIGGIVTLSDFLQTSGMIQNGANYTINAGVITLMPDSMAAAPFIDVKTGALTIDSILAGNNGLIKTGAGSLVLTGSNTYSGVTRILDGSMSLSGSLESASLTIAPGAGMLNQNGGLSIGATVTNAGSLTLDSNDIVAGYVSNGGTLANGTGVLLASTAALNAGSNVAGWLSAGTLTTNGPVLLGGTATAGSASIQSGALNLSGSLVSDRVVIARGASLINQNGGLSDTAALTNGGLLSLSVNDKVASYVSNSGTLAGGPGTLFAKTAALNGGSVVAGGLDAGTLTSKGSVFVGGIITADSIGIRSGTLTNTGTLGNATTLLDLRQGATLVADGVERYSLLTTSGSGAATWRGDLRNSTTIAPGGTGAIGILAVDGNLSQSPSGALKFDLSATRSDLMEVSGRALFDGTLELNQSGTAIAPFVPVTVVAAADYGGNITSLKENVDGAVFFNPGNGTVTRMEIPTGSGASFFGATRNQTSTWISLYDDVVEPGITNITRVPGGHDISNGIADTGNPDLLWALGSSFAPGGLNPALLNRLSPEVYGAFSDYAMQATRAHQRSALSAPPLTPRDKSKSGAGTDAKDGIAAKSVPLDWEFFAAMDYFNAGTDNSENQADYDFDGAGVLTGARTRVHERTMLSVYLGADTGTVSGELIDADAFGWTFGVLGEHLLDEKTRTRMVAGMSYGSYRFDGSRGSASATAAGWAPGDADFDAVDTDAFELFVGVDGVAWKKDALTLVPSAGLRYATTTMDSFGETTGGVGSPIALSVNGDRHESLLCELGLLAWVDVNAKVALWGEGGWNIGLLDEGRTLGASFAKGSRVMRAEADGLGDDSVYLGWGAVYRITEDIRATLGYRADFRSGADAQQEIRLSSSWRF
jgi:autotransporter-associated beta strand protein